MPAGKIVRQDVTTFHHVKDRVYDFFCVCCGTPAPLFADLITGTACFSFFQPFWLISFRKLFLFCFSCVVLTEILISWSNNNLKQGGRFFIPNYPLKQPHREGKRQYEAFKARVFRTRWFDAALEVPGV
ncbi:hypothetical protein MKJ04_06075 [Pontibacter sp. E15-1]|uniref:hypothetical protein n=1 Tax=Pontibacter sp. E15-1 TaxID=2919918 RepID=UPI001F4F8FD1|nr:hypothetical protein [Pontibacter sp. E15-1]MCJ8164405.1 hypothetical protein [Pontibacter sp. E15-1]